MTYTFKLSHRLALAHLSSMLGLLVLVVGCNTSDLTTSADSDSPALDPRYAQTATGDTETSRPGKGRGRGKRDGEPSTPSLTKLSVSPDPVSATANSKTQFVAVGVLSDGSKVELRVTWSATGGTIDSTGLYRAGTNPGRYRVLARSVSNELADTAAVTVDTEAPSVTGVTISPTNVSLQSGGTQRFSASAKLSDGSTTGENITYEATGGRIDESGLYTAGSTAGAYRVIASSSGKADTATIQIMSSSGGGNCAREVRASTASGFTSALSNAQPGDCINVAAGTYSLGTVTMGRSGTATQPIVIRGAGTATILRLGSSAAIYVDGNHVKWHDLRVTGGFWGFHTRGASGVVFDGVQVDSTEQWAIGFRWGSHQDTVRNSRIFETGRRDPAYGEGVYNGGYAEGGGEDGAADDNVIVNNFFGPNVRAEAVDNAGGADRTLIQGNVIDGTGTASIYGQTNALLVIRGNDIRIVGNQLSKGAPHGIEAYTSNRLYVQGNRIGISSSGYGVRLLSGANSYVLACDNVVTNILSGGSAYNVSCNR